MTNVGTRVRTVAVLVAGAALAIAGPASSALAVVPADGGALIDFTPITIDAGTGDQFDAHVSGDNVSYTSGSSVRYYDFFAGGNAAIPGPGDSVDRLSDVSGVHIVLARQEATGRNPILVHDLATARTIEIDPQPFPLWTNPAIGGDTIAFIDRGVVFTGELFASQLDGAAVRLTDDTRLDRQPAVVPGGGLIVYESCATSALNCDIHQAALSGGSWTITQLATAPEPEANPDTDGVVVVYDATRSGEQDIRWQPVGGGPEQSLELPGVQRNPSVSDGVILFESVALDEAQGDLWVYEIVTNRQFRITSTPTNSTLNDISRLPDGRLRIVWSEGATGYRDVFGATFMIPPPTPPTFGGFLQPVDPLPALNSLKAGAAVPVKFSLGGDRGLNIFSTGYPRSAAIECDSTATVDAVEETTTAGGSSLRYDQLTATYAYTWKTERAWAGTCRQLVLAFADGSIQRANFELR